MKFIYMRFYVHWMITLGWSAILLDKKEFLSALGAFKRIKEKVKKEMTV